jgi:hypothetical protein
MTLWRVGRKVALNVYEGDRPVCQCHDPEDAKRIVTAMNRWIHRQRLTERSNEQKDKG